MNPLLKQIRLIRQHAVHHTDCTYANGFISTAVRQSLRNLSFS